MSYLMNIRIMPFCLVVLVTILAGCQSTSQLPAQVAWHGHTINNSACIQDALDVQSMEARGAGTSVPQTRADLDFLEAFINKSERIRLTPECQSGPPKATLAITQNLKDSASFLRASNATIPPSIDPADEVATRLYKVILLYNYTPDQATNMVGTPQWNEMLGYRRMWSEAKARI